MKPLSVHECFSFGWRTFKKRSSFFVFATLIFLIVIAVSAGIQGRMTHELGTALGGVLAGLFGLVVETFIGIGLIVLYLKAHTSVSSPTLADLWQPKPFVRVFFSYLMLAVVLLVGYLFFIVPGIVLTVMLFFTTTLVIDKHLEPVAAMEESARITKGSRIPLLYLIFAIAGANALGVLALGVGLLVSMPVSMLAIVHAYRTLSARAASPVRVA